MKQLSKRLLVTGDREWTDFDMIKAAIAAESPDVVIEGEARGADKMARIAAELLGIPVLKFPAQWDRYHLGAGPKRNQQMLDEGKPTLVFAFHDDIEHSKGTRDMVTRAENNEIEVRYFKHEVPSS